MQDKDGDGFLFLANHPGLDFINTRVISRRGRVELLNTPHDLLLWAYRACLLETGDFAAAENNWLGQEGMNQALRDAIRLRDALELALRAISAPTLDDQLQKELAACVAVVNGYLTVPAIGARLSGKPGNFRLVDYPLSADGLVPLIARQASGIFTRLERRLIKKCRNQDCILYFYDTSKNQGRAWCSMDLCGNRAKAARHYQKESAG